MQPDDTEEPVVLAFATPIYRKACPLPDGFNAALKQTILTRRDRQPSTSKSNIGGWQSTPDFMTWGGPQVQQLGPWLNEAFGVVMEKQVGHRNNHWSAVYYVDLGAPDAKVSPNGALEFTDPRGAVGVYDLPGLLSVSTWTIQPQPGNLIMFPSWLKHGVLPFRGQGERISIAFNLRVTELKPT